jgi:hypothetical protein
VTRLLALLVAALLLHACNQAPAVVQPIQFSHKVHVDKGLPCDGCHQSVEKAAFCRNAVYRSSAGFPGSRGGSRNV